MSLSGLEQIVDGHWLEGVPGWVPDGLTYAAQVQVVIEVIPDDVTTRLTVRTSALGPGRGLQDARGSGNTQCPVSRSGALP